MNRSALIGVAALVFGAAAAVVAVVLYRREQADRPQDIPPLLFPAAPATRRRRAAAPPLVASSAPAYSAATAPPVAAPPSAPVVVAPPVSAPIQVPVPAAVPENAIFEGKTIRFHNPLDGTLQILPGRLEVVGGADRGQSIRFVRAGSDSEITFGRSDGPPYRHIQLRAPTVSRQHARMRHEESGWSIVNLSQTNPVVVNGQELARDGAARPLRDGDRIEMGEVTFLFRER